MANGPNDPVEKMSEELKAAMMQAVHEFFEQRISPTTSEGSVERRLQLATAALLVCVTKADGVTKADEVHTVMSAVQSAFGLDEDETRRLVRLSEEQVKVSGAFAEFTRLIDESFDLEQKKTIITLLWEVAYSDAELGSKEEYLIRKISGLLHVPFPDFADAKIQARDRFR